MIWNLFLDCSLEHSIRKIYQVLSRIPPPQKQAEKSDHEMWSGSGDCFTLLFVSNFSETTPNRFANKRLSVLSDESSTEKPKDKKKKNKDQDSNVSFLFCECSTI